MKNKNVTIFRIATGWLTFQMLLSAGFYFFAHQMAADMILALGFPEFIIYPLGIAKILGVTAIWTNKYPWLSYMAYAGFFINLSLGVVAHLMVGDGEFAGALVALISAIVSFVYFRKTQTNIA
jgi:hypothetical protein